MDCVTKTMNLNTRLTAISQDTCRKTAYSVGMQMARVGVGKFSLNFPLLFPAFKCEFADEICAGGCGGLGGELSTAVYRVLFLHRLCVPCESDSSIKNSQ